MLDINPYFKEGRIRIQYEHQVLNPFKLKLFFIYLFWLDYGFFDDRIRISFFHECTIRIRIMSTRIHNPVEETETAIEVKILKKREREK